MQNLGQIFGQVIAFAVLFNITKNFKPGWAYYLVGTWCIIGGILVLFMVTEPKINNAREDKRAAKMSLCTKIKSLMYMSCKTIGKDSTMIIGLPGLGVGYMSNILIQILYQEWMQTFVQTADNPDGPITLS